MAYRADIDGLRAIAVLAVLAFHFQIADLASGGFVGVDVFFVLSGYLITGLILEESAHGRFSLAAFYRRRVGRLLPALFIVYAACVAASWNLDFPVEAAQTSRSLLASMGFVSNILFYARSDYFSPLAESDPLLHTWSLSVEEQFYLLFPLLMLGTLRLRPAARVRLLALLAAASFAWACRTVETDRTAAFYLMPSRAWELLLGALLAAGILPAPGRWSAEMLAASGLALVCGSILLIDTSMSFPGALAAVPCLGTAAILHAGGRPTATARALSLPPLRYVGLISYSLYLWHWPVLTYYRRVDVPLGGEKVALALACVVLAALSYHLVERPFRARIGTMRFGTVAAAIAGAATCLVAGLGLLRLLPVLRPMPAAAASVLAYVDYDSAEQVREGSCFLTERTGGFRGFRPADCLAGDPGRRNVLLVGDSHAAHLRPGLVLVHAEINVLQATASLCKPFLPARGTRRCRDLLDYVEHVYLPSHRPDVIVLAARWRAEDLDALKGTIATLHGLTDRIVVVGPIVEYDQSLPRLLAQDIRWGTLRTAASRSTAPDRADRALAAGLADAGITYVSLLDRLCTPDCMVWARPGQPLQFDLSHLTVAGSMEIASRLEPALFSPITRTRRARCTASAPQGFP